MLKFPDHEQRNHIDIYTGMMFYFVPKSSHSTSEAFETEQRKPWVESNIAWTVIHKELTDSPSICWRFLLLGAGKLIWHTGPLGWIRRVADPVWEERASSMDGDFRRR